MKTKIILFLSIFSITQLNFTMDQDNIYNKIRVERCCVIKASMFTAVVSAVALALNVTNNSCDSNTQVGTTILQSIATVIPALIAAVSAFSCRRGEIQIN